MSVTSSLSRQWSDRTGDWGEGDVAGSATALGNVYLPGLSKVDQRDTPQYKTIFSRFAMIRQNCFHYYEAGSESLSFRVYASLHSKEDLR